MSFDEKLVKLGLCPDCAGDNHAAPSSLLCVPCQQRAQQVADAQVARLEGVPASSSPAELSR